MSAIYDIDESLSKSIEYLCFLSFTRKILLFFYFRSRVCFILFFGALFLVEIVSVLGMFYGGICC